jgi:hypothetical protein
LVSPLLTLFLQLQNQGFALQICKLWRWNMWWLWQTKWWASIYLKKFSSQFYPSSLLNLWSDSGERLENKVKLHWSSSHRKRFFTTTQIYKRLVVYFEFEFDYDFRLVKSHGSWLHVRSYTGILGLFGYQGGGEGREGEGRGGKT